MKIWKTLSGILSLFAAAFIALLFLFTDLLELLANPLQIETFGSPGAAGAIMAAALAFGGIITLATRDGGRGGSIAASILYGVGGVVGLVLAGDHLDLRVCAAWSLLCMVAAMVDIGTTEPIHEEDLEAYEEEQRRAYPEPPSAAPAQSTPAPAPAGRTAAKPIPATLQQVLTEEDPWKRNAAIDALPEKQAKSYLKQVLSTLAGRENGDEEADGLVRTLIVVLAIVGLALVAVIAVGIFGALGMGPGAALSQPAGQSVRPSEQTAATPEPSRDVPPTANPVPGSGTLGDSYVEIKEAFLTSDYQGNPAVVVAYAWTNNGPETTNAMDELVELAFQNGAELTMATVTSSQRYQSGTRLLDVQPGGQAEVQCAFHLESITAPIEFQISEFLGGSGTVVYASFDPDALAVEQ